MTELPKTIRVSAFDISITDLPHGDEINRWGDFNASRQGIRIDHNLLKNHPAKYVDCLFHEIGHAIYWSYGILDEDKEERVVGAMASAWTQIFRDNPSLLRRMQKQLKEAERTST